VTLPTRTERFAAQAAALGFPIDSEIRIGGHYRSVARHGDTVYVSGQIPRINDTVVVTGRVGAGTSLEQAQHAAKVCAMRALALLQQELGSLDHIRQLLRMTVYVQCAEDFTHHSEVADGASHLLHHILGDAGLATRTSVGVYQLPKNASVELDLIACSSI
jgi:enamine deaminase RidA (YjgF/YER057c/UK114 family)